MRSGFALILNHNTGDFEERALVGDVTSDAVRRYKDLGIVDVAGTGAERYETVTDPQVGRLLKAMEKDGFRGFLAAPLEAKHELLGAVCLLHRANEAVPEAAVATLRALTDQVALVVRNIQYNEELARKNEELTHLDQLKSDFMATMSHELRTPLTSIIGYSDMLLSGMTGELNEKQSAVRRQHPQGRRVAAQPHQRRARPHQDRGRPPGAQPRSRRPAGGPPRRPPGGQAARPGEAHPHLDLPAHRPAPRVGRPGQAEPDTPEPASPTGSSTRTRTAA